jgi:hypothetical protein
MDGAPILRSLRAGILAGNITRLEYKSLGGCSVRPSNPFASREVLRKPSVFHPLLQLLALWIHAIHASLWRVVEKRL